MNHYKLLISMAILVFLLSSCSKEDENASASQIAEFNLTKLKIGQTFNYVLLTGAEYNNNDVNDNFEYTKDTLRIEVVEQIGNGFVISETILPGSNMFLDQDNYYWFGKDSTYKNLWTIENEVLNVQPLSLTESLLRSHLLYRGRQFELDLSRNNEEEVQIDGWKTTAEYCECSMDLYTNEPQILNNQYDHLNIAIRNIPMQTDGNGSTYIYSEEEGIVRTSNYSWWTAKGIAWDRLN